MSRSSLEDSLSLPRAHRGSPAIRQPNRASARNGHIRSCWLQLQNRCECVSIAKSRKGEALRLFFLDSCMSLLSIA